MNALEVRNFITEHVGRHGRRSEIFVSIWNQRTMEDELHKIKGADSTEIICGGADVVLEASELPWDSEHWPIEYYI
jgi:hypothetical protein